MKHGVFERLGTGLRDAMFDLSPQMYTSADLRTTGPSTLHLTVPGTTASADR